MVGNLNFNWYTEIVGNLNYFATVGQRLTINAMVIKENETFGPSRKELRCDLKNYNFFFIFRIANNKLIDILEVEKNEKK